MALAVPAAVWAQDNTVEVKAAPSPALEAALQEFRNQAARLAVGGGGGRAGAQGQTKGGGRGPARTGWHGRIFENLRNDAFDAIPHQIRQRGGEQRRLRRNQYGGSVTGPVVLPKVYNGTGKTFFTFTYEGMRETIGQFTMDTVPTTLERTGHWAHVVDPNGRPLPIYDPASTFLNPAFDPSLPVSTSNLQYMRQQFPGNVIPVARLDPVALAALEYLPQPNTNAGPFFQNNYYAVTPEVNRADGFILTLDHSFGQKHRVTARINSSTGQNGNAPVFNTIANSNNPPQLQTSRGLRVEHIYTASPTSVNNLQVSLESNANRNVPGGLLNGKPFPRYQFAGVYLPMGQNNPISRDAFNNFRISDTYALRWRQHRISLQGEVTQNQIHTFRPQSPEGRFDFTAGLTSLPGIINTGHPFASFLLGGAAFATQSIVVSPNYYRWEGYRWIVNDTWQIRPSLTLTMGANLETFTQRRDKYNRQSNISLTAINPENGRPGALVVAGMNGQGRTFLPAWTRLEPSLSLAWSVLGNNNTVLRLSYDRRYSEPNQNNGHWGTQAFNGQPTYLSPNQQLQPAVVLREGLRPSRFPDLRPESANGTNADLWDPYGFQPTNQNFRAELQHQVVRNLIVTVSFNRQYGKNDFVGANLSQPNAIPIEALRFRDRLNDLSFANSLRPFPQYQDFDVQRHALGKHRNQNFSIQVEKRSSGGFAMSVQYSRFIRYDNYSAPVQNVFDRMSGWSIAQFSRPHNLDINFLYELPFGPGKRFLSSGVIGKHILGGWALSGISNFQAGGPLRLVPQFNNTGGVIRQNALYVDVVPGVNPHVKKPSPHMWFNPAAFVNPPDFSLGNGPRVHPTLRGPGAYNHDLTLNKRMAAGGDRTLEFTASFFNATNHANWNQPDTRIGTARAPNFNAGRIVGSTGGRIVQLGLRLNF